MSGSQAESFMKIIILTSTILFLAVYSIAQNKPKALKFDEIVFDEQTPYLEAGNLVKERVDRLAKRLKLERNKNVFVVLYRARVMQNSNRNRLDNIASSVKWSLSRRPELSDSIFILDGGLRQHDTIEFWITPKGELPTPTPTFTRSEGIECPSIFAYQVGFTFDKQTPVVLTVESRPSSVGSYNWTLTGGVIIGPNGRTRLEVDVRQVEGNRLTAFVELEGVPLPCKNRALVLAEFGNTSRLVDEFGRIANGELRGRLDSFLATLFDYPNAQGFVFLYGGRNVQGRDIEARKQLLTSHFRFRRFDANRITVVNAGYREEGSAEIWLVPAGTDIPEQRPSVDAAFVPAARPITRKSVVK